MKKSTKKMLTVFCAFVLAALPCLAARADAPTITVGNGQLTVTYSNPNAQGSYTYVLLDAMERIMLVEVDAADTWTPAWTEEGLFKVQAYYKDAGGVTRSEESDFKEVRFSNKKDPLYWGDFLNDNSGALPSAFTKPVEYFEPTPVPTRDPAAVTAAPQAVAPLYTFAPSAAVPAPTAVPAAGGVSYAGTRPCFEHLNIRIRISDNDSHAATKGRSGPGTDMPQVATLNIGEVFQVLDCRILEQGNVHWFMINKNGVNCWVASGRCERY